MAVHKCIFFAVCLTIDSVVDHTEYRHKALLSAALSTLAARKDQECQVALAALRAELKAEVDAAYKERDEHLENYSKVCCCDSRGY